MFGVAGDMGGRGRVPGRTGGGDRFGLCRVPRRGMGGQRESARLAYFHFAARPGPGRRDGFAWSVILRIMVLEQVKDMLGAIGRPKGQQFMFFVVHFI
jgi:hypothetical protein